MHRSETDQRGWPLTVGADGKGERSLSADESRARIRVVALLDSIGQPGGAERLAVDGVIGLDAVEFDRILCLSRWDDRFEMEPLPRDLLRRLQAADVSVVKLARGSRLNLRAWIPLIRLLRNGEVDVLHGHLFGSNFWAAVLGRLCSTPVVIAHEHMWAYTGGRFRSFIDREVIARWSDVVIAVSRFGRQQMVEVEGIAANKIAVIPNGIERQDVGDRNRVRRELEIPAEAPVVGSVGHLRREKAFEVLIEAAASLEDEVHVVIAGEGSERRRLERLLAELGLAGRVHLIGARTDVADVLAACDVAVCCSDFEGSPLSVLEYMAASLPVVASDVGGIPELITDGETGLLAPARDAGQFAAAIRRLVGDREFAARLGANASKTASQYDLESWCGELAALYKSLTVRDRVPR